MSKERGKRNHTGQSPSDIPSEALINPPRKRERKKSEPKKISTTGRSPNLGNRNDIGR